MQKYIFVLVAILVSSLSVSASPLSRRLGYSDQDRILLFHADDMGMTELTNRAVADSLHFGVAKSASIMMPAPAAKSAAQKYPDLDLGLHLTLNSEWKGHRWQPNAGPDAVPSLTAFFCPEGYMWKGRASIYVFARSRDVAKELRAQINQALSYGLKPTHMDTHMGTLLLKHKWGDAYLRLAKQYKIPPFIVRWTEHLKKQLPPLVMNHLDADSKNAERAGFLLLDWFITGIDGITFEERKKATLKMLEELQPGVTMAFMHPSYFESKNPFPKEVVTQRIADAMVMQDPDIKRAANDLGIKLIGWKDIQKAYDWDSIRYP